MKWKQWKELVESQGVTDDTEIYDVNVRPGYIPGVHLRPETKHIKASAIIGSGWPFNEDLRVAKTSELRKEGGS